MDQTIKQKVIFNKWLVFIGAYTVITLDIGFMYALSKLFVMVLDTFHETRAATAAIPAVCTGVSQAFGIITGAFVHKFGPRKAGLLGSLLIFIGFTSSFLATSVTYLIISIGVCFALGSTLAFICCTTAVGLFFPGKSNLIALSVLSTGSGIGGMLYPYLVDSLSANYGLRGILLIFGGLTSHGFASSLLYGKRNSRQLTENDKRKKYSLDEDMIGAKELKTLFDNDLAKQTNALKLASADDAKIGPTKNHQQSGNSNTVIESMMILLRNKVFFTFSIGITFLLPAFSYYTIFLVDIFIDKGFATADASFGLVIFNIFSVIGRLTPGFLSQLPCISTLFVPITASCVGILATLTLLFVESFVAVILCTGSIGLAHGVITSSISVTTASLIGKDHLSNGIGILFTLLCFPTLTVGPISGMLRDMTGSYNDVFVIAAVMMGVGLLIIILAQYFHSLDMKSRERASPVI